MYRYQSSCYGLASPMPGAALFSLQFSVQAGGIEASDLPWGKPSVTMAFNTKSWPNWGRMIYDDLG